VSLADAGGHDSCDGQSENKEAKGKTELELRQKKENEEGGKTRKSTQGSGAGEGGGSGGTGVARPPATEPQGRSMGSGTGQADDFSENACESQAECKDNSNWHGGVLLKSKAEVTKVNVAEHVTEIAQSGRRVKRRIGNDDVEMEEGGGSHETVPTREDAAKVDKDEEAANVNMAGEKKNGILAEKQSELPISLSAGSKNLFDKSNCLTRPKQPDPECEKTDVKQKK